MPLSEFLLGLPVERLGLNPAIKPRHLVGLLQQRVWSVVARTPENLIPDNTQQNSQQQTETNAKGGGDNSHSGPFTWPLSCQICAIESTLRTVRN